MDYQYSSLNSCINSLSASVGLLNDSLKVLDESIKDLPRIKNVLEIEKVFSLVPECDLIGAKTTLQDQIEPKVSVIMSKINNEINKLERKKINLRSKVDLQQVRMESASKHSIRRYSSINDKRIIGNDQQFTRLKFLQNKKERLKYSLSRLNLQDRKAKLTK